LGVILSGAKDLIGGLGKKLQNRFFGRWPQNDTPKRERPQNDTPKRERPQNDTPKGEKPESAPEGIGAAGIVILSGAKDLIDRLGKKLQNGFFGRWPQNDIPKGRGLRVPRRESEQPGLSS